MNKAPISLSRTSKAKHSNSNPDLNKVLDCSTFELFKPVSKQNKERLSRQNSIIQSFKSTPKHAYSQFILEEENSSMKEKVQLQTTEIWNPNLFMNSNHKYKKSLGSRTKSQPFIHSNESTRMIENSSHDKKENVTNHTSFQKPFFINFHKTSKREAHGKNSPLIIKRLRSNISIDHTIDSYIQILKENGGCFTPGVSESQRIIQSRKQRRLVKSSSQVSTDNIPHLFMKPTSIAKMNLNVRDSRSSSLQNIENESAFHGTFMNLNASQANKKAINLSQVSNYNSQDRLSLYKAGEKTRKITNQLTSSKFEFYKTFFHYVQNRKEDLTIPSPPARRILPKERLNKSITNLNKIKNLCRSVFRGEKSLDFFAKKAQ